jgi:hypothetical protein
MKYDVIILYSSLEHDGLGRYGYPITPNGDIDACIEAYSMLNKEGYFNCRIPIGNTFTVLDGSVKSSIDKIKPTNYENYFIYAYNKEYYKNKLNNKKYTRRKTLNIYKNE